MNETYEHISRQWVESNLQEWIEIFIAKNWDVQEFVCKSPAEESEISAIEEKLEIKIPPTFRYILKNVSRQLEFSWFKPSELEFSKPFEEIFCGDLSWSLDDLPQMSEDGESRIEALFPNKEDSYDLVWHNKLVFFEVGNGDCIALDLNKDSYGKIVYLSNADGEGHGFVMADNFCDLLLRWIPLACCGGEDWQWLPFTSNKVGGINPNCENAKKWKEILS